MKGCDSSTTTPALVYFPPGTYMVSKPVIAVYYTQIIGDPTDMPVIKGLPKFEGMALIDSDPYTDTGANWYTNQNNFFRSVRNIVVDLTAMPKSTGAGIHWQVGQATDMRNVRFEMVKGGGADNKQQGIFMDNGSGGSMADLTFNGGNYGMFVGNQQFTTRNLAFNDCNAAIFMNWNWAWTFKNVNINNCHMGLNMSNSPQNQTVGSVLLLDSKLTNTDIGVMSAWGEHSFPISAGTLVLQNVDFSGSKSAVAGVDGSQMLAGGSVVSNYVQGNTYTPSKSLNKRATQPKVVTQTVVHTIEACPANYGPQGSNPQGSNPQDSNPPAPQPQNSANHPHGSQNQRQGQSGETPVTVQPQEPGRTAPVQTSNQPQDGQAPAINPGTVLPHSPTENAGSGRVAEPTAGGEGRTGQTGGNPSVTISFDLPGLGSTPTPFPIGGPSSSSSAPLVPSVSIPSILPSSSPGHCRKEDITRNRIQKTLEPQHKAHPLMADDGSIFERSKPTYADVPASSFLSVKSAGAKGDGQTDDTQAIQKTVDSAAADQIVYFDHGAYIITSTVKVPKNIKIVGEIWPVIMAHGKAFSDEKNPIPVFQVGQPGDKGNVEITDVLFSTKGPAPGAIMMEWNIAEETQGSAAMFDVPFRIGGAAGTELQSDTCMKTPNRTTTPDPQCVGAFMLFHATKKSSGFIDNCWFWTADHELDLPDHDQINIYTGRGVLLESKGPMWLYGTASEHHQLYEYQVSDAKNIFMGLIQTETPYFQSNPNALVPFSPQARFDDPDFSTCVTDKCRKAWGLRVLDSSDVWVYGAGLYSFFEDYQQQCLDSEDCQENMVQVDCSDVHIYGLSTKASVNMVTGMTGNPLVREKDNMSNYCATIALFEQ